MRLRPTGLLHGLHLALLRCASLLVPAVQRAEWSQEWQAELWHVRDACTPAGGVSWSAERVVAAFCLGAFQDAACLKRQYGPSAPLATTMGYGAGLLTTGVQLQSVQYRDARHLMLIQNARCLSDFGVDDCDGTVPAMEAQAAGGIRWVCVLSR
jgi:hypothetical protein